MKYIIERHDVMVSQIVIKFDGNYDDVHEAAYEGDWDSELDAEAVCDERWYHVTPVKEEK